MSQSVMSVGIIAPLTRKLTRDEWDEWGGKLWNKESLVRFNHEGTLAVTDMLSPRDGFYLGPIRSLSLDAFDDLKQFGLEVVHEFAYIYREAWYNSGDPWHYTITLDQFLEKTAQRNKWVRFFPENT